VTMMTMNDREITEKGKGTLFVPSESNKYVDATTRCLSPTYKKSMDIIIYNNNNS